MKFDQYGALMINRGNSTLIVFHLYCCNPCSFCHVDILIQNIGEVIQA